MELLLTLIVSFLLSISFLLAPCAPDQFNLKKTLQHVDHAKFAQSSLPRKLNLNHETVKGSADEEDFTPRNEFQQASLGTKQHENEENVINAAEKETKGTEVEEEDEEEGSNKSEYFTMDYRWVKKRRPIHNKQILFVP